MPTDQPNQELKHLSSLYGGYWNKNVLDFCYMTNRYFPPQQMVDDMQATLPELIGHHPSTNWHLSLLVASHLCLPHTELFVGNGPSDCRTPSGFWHTWPVALTARGTVRRAAEGRVRQAANDERVGRVRRES